MIKIDGNNFETVPRDGKNSLAELESAITNNGTKPSESEKNSSTASLSKKGVALSNIDKELADYLRENPLPRYFSIQTYNDRVVAKAQSLGNEYGIQLDKSDIDFLVKPNEKRSPTPSIDNGNVFDFLSETDRLELEKAHNFALQNGTSLDDVENTAFEMSVKRRKEAMEAQGTRFVELDKDVDFGTFLLNIERGGNTSGGNELEVGSIEYQELIKRFSNNPILMEIFSKISSNMGNSTDV